MLLPGIVANSVAAVASGGPPYSADLDVWFDASDTATITTSGTEVTQWDDKSGNNHHAVTLSGYNGPHSPGTTHNGLNMVDFVQANSEVLDLVDGILITPKTIFSVLKWNANNSIAWSAANSSYFTSETGQIFLHRIVVDKVDFRINDPVTKLARVNTNPDNTTYIDTCCIDLVSPMHHYKNTTKVIGNSVDSGTWVNGPTFDAYLGAGKHNNAPYYYYGGSMGEILIYNRRLSDSEVAEVQTYLNDKWVCY